MVKFYLGEEAIIQNVETFVLRNPDHLEYVLANLPKLVVKEVHGAGGYGMLIGPAATQARDRGFPRPHQGQPERYIAQPTLALSTSPTFGTTRRRAAAHRPASLRAVAARTSPSYPVA